MCCHVRVFWEDRQFGFFVVYLYKICWMTIVTKSNEWHATCLLFGGLLGHPYLYFYFICQMDFYSDSVIIKYGMSYTTKVKLLL